MAKNKKVQKQNGKKPSVKHLIRKSPPVTDAPDKPELHRGIFRISPVAFMSLFSGRHMFEVVKNPLPRDAKVLDIRFDYWENDGVGAIEVLLEHPAIPAIDEGQQIPVIAPPVFQNISTGGGNISRKGFRNSVVKK